MSNLFRYRLAAGGLFGLLAIHSPAQAEMVTLPYGLTIDLPEGWRVEGPEQGTLSKDGFRRVHLVCGSEACERSLETCTFLLREKPLEGADDAAKVRALYDSPFERYFRMRAVLRATSKDAEVLKPLELTRIGTRDWYRIETDAHHNYKSGYFAETVVNGLYVGAICKTCETGEVRHQDGQKILTSLTAGVAKAALAPR